jgi:hypothetical protein
MPISYNRVEIDVDLALALIAQGLPWKVVTKALGASRQTVLTRLKEAGHEQPLRTPGRPRAITGELGDVIRAKSLLAIAEAAGVKVWTICSILRRYAPDTIHRRPESAKAARKRRRLASKRG